MNPMNSLSIFGFALPQRDASPESQGVASTPVAQRKTAETKVNKLCAELDIPARLTGDLPPHTYLAMMEEILVFLLERERDRQ